MDSYKKFNYKDLLEPFTMLRLYSSGAFPMADDTGFINWYLPEVRAIIPLDNYNIPKSLKKDLNKFEYKFDSDFLSVVENCADRETTWITNELIKAYLRLQKMGHIHTVETWQNGKLVGGLYGITFKGAFFGESMFSKTSQASKAALAKLIERLNEKKFALLDVQYITPHLKMFGAKEIDFDEFQKLLDIAYSGEFEF